MILRPRRRLDYPRQTREHREEYAAEINPLPLHASQSRKEAGPAAEEKQGSRMLGYAGLAFGIASLFIWSAITGPAAIVLGLYAYSKGRKTAGAWAIGLGFVAALSYFVMIPFAR
ncbi:hypothetical protein B9T62_23990 [Paenibacillus donghaensis]|uniref:DUF4190 domain-containing protein n=1 Tax=Paenibacillus donghaensis TaxID=414771 RepID=A0A2Z2KJL0_9BACL|nr:hypothetical protein B9T62_23990 [Paenibacillus donghaensis]